MHISKFKYIFFNGSAHESKNGRFDNKNQTSALPVQYGEIQLDPSDVTSSDKAAALKWAIDKDLSTVESALTTSLDSDIWIKFNLSETHFVDKVVIYLNFLTGFYNPNGGCMTSEDRFRECKQTQKGLEVSVFQADEEQKSCGTIELSLGLKQSDQIYTFDCAGAKGNAVILTKTPVDGNTKLPLWEIVIFRVVPGEYMLKFDNI